MTSNTSSASLTTDGNWKAPDGTIFQTPGNNPPVSDTPITIFDNGVSKPGTWINNQPVETKTTS
jgi:hypothetical protein